MFYENIGKILGPFFKIFSPAQERCGEWDLKSPLSKGQPFLKQTVLSMHFFPSSALLD